MCLIGFVLESCVEIDLGLVVLFGVGNFQNPAWMCCLDNGVSCLVCSNLVCGFYCVLDVSMLVSLLGILAITD